MIYLFFKDISKTERFTDTEADAVIRSVVTELYNADILAIRKLSNYATQINGSLYINNNIDISGNISTQDLSCKNINSEGNIDISGTINANNIIAKTNLIINNSKDGFSSTISNRYDPNSLCIVGQGDSPDRKVTIWDNVEIKGKLTIGDFIINDSGTNIINSSNKEITSSAASCGDGNVLSNGNNIFTGTNNFTALSISSNPFRFVSWRTCGYTITPGTSFGGAITAANEPMPAIDSTTKYIYSIIGNTLYLEFSYNNPTPNRGVDGTGVYLYNLPSGYTIDTSLIQTVTLDGLSSSQNVYGTKLGNVNLEIFTHIADKYSYLGVSIYATTPTTLAIFIPVSINTKLSTAVVTTNHINVWHGSTCTSYNELYNSYTFSCSFPIV